MPSIYFRAVLVAATAASASSAPPEPPSTMKQASFSDSLTSALYNDDPANNECTSSWGVSMLFDLVYSGGTTQSVQDMCTVLGLCGPYIAASPEEDEEMGLHWKSLSDALTSSYDGACAYEPYPEGSECDRARPTVLVANSVWIDDEEKLDLEYAAVAGEFLHQIDFDASPAGELINAWVNQTTIGLIDSIVESGPIQNHDMVAVNSIYLKASWSNQFELYNTNQDAFYTDSTRFTQLPQDTHFMHQIESFPYSATAVPGFQLIKIPYAYSKMSMVVALPLSPDVDAITSSTVIEALTSLESRKMALALPKFKFQRKYDGTALSGVLRSLGLEAPFEEAEGFCALLDGNCAFLDYIVQKTHIQVDEMGTKAAAVTAGFFKTASVDVSQPILFQADHPFQFFVLNEFNDDGEKHGAEDVLVLFEGKVVNPGTAGSSTPALSSRHADEQFWSAQFGFDPIREDPYVVEQQRLPTTPFTKKCDEKKDVGVFCDYDDECCSGRCDGRPGHRKCRFPVVPEMECPDTDKRKKLGRECGKSKHCCSARCSRDRRGSSTKVCSGRRPRLAPSP